MTDTAQTRMMENLYWWGIPTLFRCPIETDPAACDIALAGVPLSTGTGPPERDPHPGPPPVSPLPALPAPPHPRAGPAPGRAAGGAGRGAGPRPGAPATGFSSPRYQDAIPPSPGSGGWV